MALTQERVKELFDYVDGELIWKISPTNSVKAGDVAGSIGGHGYSLTSVDNKKYSNHLIIWVWHYGYLPEHEIDHRDRIRTNNRIGNLRELSHLCNIRNSKQRLSLSGVKGVSWISRKLSHGVWRAYICVHGKISHLGYFSDLTEAVAHRLAAEQALNWEGCDSTSPSFIYMQNIANQRGYNGIP